ncbi:hypothetical protein M427DRAFT_28153 [Gonapodya prolifera JEL478]|uniref:Uncharacterized protein n=1 Tax=Gonapodya prolifera (strain JEL478) TaxID=1344416 RepID=A0A139AUK6_GONPJ|nr:hypothetical protein M427DRAFT_28153 [Gonapodya prolifera JEL478]|eukprot:KXS20426.1 hypothetical protein M427DRAFT_28153 [Gonapodya prolifera JEL478]
MNQCARLADLTAPASHGSVVSTRGHQVLSKVQVDAQECVDSAGALLSTFQDEIGEIALSPGASGEWKVVALPAPQELHVVWDRKEKKGFPEITELKRLVRDVVAPGKSLGHADRQAAASEARADDNQGDKE